MNNEWERILQETISGWFDILFWNIPAENQDTDEDTSVTRTDVSRDLNPRTHEHEAEVQATPLQRSYSVKFGTIQTQASF
jgi:hypothetical protein